MRSTFALSLCLAAGAALAQAPAAPAAKVIQPGDNLLVQGIPAIPADVAERVARYTEGRTATLRGWHPTKREMLIGTRFADTVQIHIVRMPQGDRTQLTFFPDRVAGGSFQPTHGNYFLFSKDVGGGEWHQLYRYDMADGAITLLTDGKSRNTGATWNRAGDRIAYSSTRRTGKDNDLYVMDPADPKTDRLLLQLPGGGWSPEAWSPDGQQLVISEYNSVNESKLWLVDVATATKKLLLSIPSDEQVAFGGAKFSRDGKSIFVTTDAGFEFKRLARLDIASGQMQFLTSDIPWDVGGMSLSDDGRTMAFLTNEAGVSKLHFLDTATNRHRPGPNLPVGVIGTLAWHKNNRDLGFTHTTARMPADVFSIDVTNNSVTRWTTSESGGLDTSKFVDAKPIEWKSFDGRAISGFLYMPPAKFTGKRPVVVSIHGGPEGQSRPTFLGQRNYLLNELGVAIVFPNIRGSVGYGKNFAKLDNGFLREDSYKDLDALLDWIKAQPQLDGNRILITGGSYGGHATLAVAANYSDKICCSIDVVGMSNLVTFLENTESYRRDLRRAEYGDERDPKMREFLTRIAPMTKAGQIRKPMFVVQGKNDPRVPASEAIQIVDTLKQTQTPVWFLMASDEGHGFAKRKNRDFQLYAELMFIEQFLLK